MTDPMELVERLDLRAIAARSENTATALGDAIHFEQAAACIRELVEWRPIETAPKDGTPLLAASENHDSREVVCWQDGPQSGSWDSLAELQEGWVNDGPIKDRFYANPRYFTHWLPLPSPPARGGV